MSQLPDFTIALPVYNGGLLLKDCVQSILSQSYPHFKLLVFNSFDNTDGSTEYLKSISDSRLRIIQAERKLTIEGNWSRIKDALNTEFATIIGQDDLLQTDFLLEIKKKILEQPEASLWHSHYKIINASGEIIKTCKPMPSQESLYDYLRSVLTVSAETVGTGYVFRSADYKKIGGIPLFTDLLFADFALWIKLTSFSYKVNHSRVLFSFRLHDSTTSKAAPDKYFEAFRSFIDFLFVEAKSNEDFKKSIHENIYTFLRFYAETISLRIIKAVNQGKNQKSLSVDRVLNFCLETYEKSGNHGFPGFTYKTIIAALIDKYAILKNGFRLVKRIYSKPFLR